MIFKCEFCPRTFSNRTAYSQHVSVCAVSITSSEESSLISDINNMSLDSENFSSSINVNKIGNKNEVIKFIK